MLSHRLQYGIFLYSQLLLFHFQTKSSMAICIAVPHHHHHQVRHHRHNELSKIYGQFSLPIESTFQLPSPLPIWPKGGGFAIGVIDLGGLQVTKVTSFRKIWASHEGGPDNLGVTLLEPSPIPEGFALLGCYGQPNNNPLSGWVLVGKDCTNHSSSNGALANPIDYSLVWSSQSLNIKQDGPVFIWFPIPPAGYKAVGHIITTSPDRPPLDRVRCVRADLTDQCGPNGLIWGSNGLNIYTSKPLNIRVGAAAVSLGTFIAQLGGESSPSNNTSACLKNSNPNLPSAMPNIAQIETLIQAYSPMIYLHPDEEYHPSTVNWYFANGALLYTKGNESNPVQIQPNGSNLPQGGSNDGSYWLDLPTNDNDKQRVKRGDFNTSGCYFHIKPMLGGTFTDLATFVFYPFNGPARAKLGVKKSVSLGKIGEHVGDWEHVTLRISNFNGELNSVYFSQHGKGAWVEATDLEFQNGNRVVAYSSLHGHAMYPKTGLVVHGNGVVGIRDDTARSSMVLDAEKSYEVISADYNLGIVEPPWVNYMREWGPKITYDIGKEIGKVTKLLPGMMKKEFEKVVRSLPPEAFGEQGPTGPKVKNNWFGDES